MKKSIYLVLSLFFAVSALFAQSIPPSFRAENAFIPQPQVYNAVLQQNISVLRAEGLELERNGEPMRIAVGIPADLQLINESVPAVRLASGKQIRRQVVYSAGAYGLILTFGELFIPEGGILFVYTENREQMEVFTHETNPAGTAFATTIFHQNKVILEYVESTISNELPRIHITDVAFVYRSQAELRRDLSCMISINCSEGDDWYAQSQGIVHTRITRGGNTFICSGSLINNVREDGTPFILTAYHCIRGWNEQSMLTMRFYFFAVSASTNCFDQSSATSTGRARVGAHHRASIPLAGGSDGSLLELRTPIPIDWHVFFNGWDRTTTPAASGVSIHHPAGMVQKISTFSQPLVSGPSVNFGGIGVTPAGATWRVQWSSTINGHSVTAPGSSGSPIFNQNGHIVGTLVGGSSGCTYGIVDGLSVGPSHHDFYGKLSWHWGEMGRFLDPDNTGTMVLDGFNRSSVNLPPPVAAAATNITYNSFQANWQAVSNATRYYLDVFYLDNSTRVYVDGFQRRNVRNVTSFEITGLRSDAEYFYVVRAGASIDSESPPSNQISVTTLIPGFTDLIVTATEAANITDIAFQANWEALSDAIGYFLNVYQRIRIIGGYRIDYVPGFEMRDVGNVLLYRVEGLDKDTEYHFTVVASDGINLSRVSNEITFRTLEYYDPGPGNGNGEITEIQVFVDSGNIIIYTPSAEDLRIFSILGQRILTQVINKGRTEVPTANFSQGVYIVVIGSDAHKIVVR